MATPLRKNEPELEAEQAEQNELTTSDLARAKGPVREIKRPLSVIEGSRGESATPPTVPVDTQTPTVRDATRESRGIETESGLRSDVAPLFPGNELEGLRTRWKEIQTAFVDEPRKAVEQADSLVASAMHRLAEVFADERSKLEQQWDRGDSVSTEDLRLALQRYRTFFERLLSV
jgi:hypothetical protein